MKELSSPEIVTIAVYLLGGATQRVDTEDIAKKVNEIAPGRFTWRKYKDQINIEVVRAFLSDAKKQKNRTLLVGSGNDGWLMTSAGVSFAKTHLNAITQADLARQTLPRKQQTWLRMERERMLSSEALQKFLAGDIAGITSQDAEAFFRLDAYVTGKPREEKILRATNAFADDPELGPATQAILKKLPNYQK